MEKQHRDQDQASRAGDIAATSPILSLSADSPASPLDSRPEAVAQRQVQEAANQSPQVQQLKGYQQLANSQVGAVQRSAAPVGPIQRLPSDMRDTYGEDPLLNLGFFDRKKHWNWSTYTDYINQYIATADLDQNQQRLALARIYPLAKALYAAKKTGFTQEQQDLGDKIELSLDAERTELLGKEIGLLIPSLNDQAFTAADPISGDQVADQYVDQSDPFAFPLFTKLPNIEDVKQGELGDCYLLATVSSILATDPSHFMTHMKDQMNGKVTVKFYKDDLAPLLVTVDKSVVGDKYAQDSLWVKLLEKAYVASGLKTKDVGAKGGRKYEDISGGESSAAFVHLTGKASKHVRLGFERGSRDFGTEILGLIQPIKDELGKLSEEKTELQKDKETNKVRIKEIEVRENLLLDEFLKLQAPLQELDNALQMVYFSDRQFREFIAKHKNNEPVMQALQKLIPDPEGFFPGELGSGEYGRDDIKAWKETTQALDAKLPVTAATKNQIDDPENEVEGKGAAGESKVGGLASSHAYSVLAHREVDKSLQLKLRNPWGAYGRKYVEVLGKVKGIADDASNGTFWIDIADFVAYFDNIAIGQV